MRPLYLIGFIFYDDKEYEYSLVAVNYFFHTGLLTKCYLTFLLEGLVTLLFRVGSEHSDEGVVAGLLLSLLAPVEHVGLDSLVFIVILVTPVDPLLVDAVHHVLLHDAHAAVLLHCHHRHRFFCLL